MMDRIVFFKGIDEEGLFPHSFEIKRNLKCGDIFSELIFHTEHGYLSLSISNSLLISLSKKIMEEFKIELKNQEIECMDIIRSLRKKLSELKQPISQYNYNAGMDRGRYDLSQEILNFLNKISEEI